MYLWKSQIVVFLLAIAGTAAAQDQAQAHEHAYRAFTVDVPFKFSLGQRMLGAGSYQFILLGPGLLAIGDLQKRRIVATLLTRQMPTAPAPPATKLVFTNDRKYARLTSILLEHEAQGLEILGEDVARRQNPPAALPRSVLDLEMIQRRYIPSPAH